MSRCLVIGHKGASKLVPENTLRAFEKAIELKADLIEFDIHLSKDNHIVIIHDADIFSITGHHGLVKEMTLDQLKQYDFGKGEKIPTLEELIEIAKGKIGLQVEIKARGLEKKLVSLLRKNDLIDSSLISCFIHSKLIKIQKLEPHLKLGALEPAIVGREPQMEDYERMVKNAVDHNFYAIHPEFTTVKEELIELAHENNVKVHPWTVNDVNELKKLIDMEVDGIITDDIETLNHLLGREWKT